MCSASISWSLPLFFSTISFVLSFSFIFQICLHDFTTTSTWMEQRTRLEGKLQKQEELQKVAHHRKEKTRANCSQKKHECVFFSHLSMSYGQKNGGCSVDMQGFCTLKATSIFFIKKGSCQNAFFLFQNGVQKIHR